MKYLGFDPSLRNWGWVLAEQTKTRLTLLDMGTISVEEPSCHKYANDAFCERTGRLLEAVLNLPYSEVAGIYAEAPVGSQSAAAQASYATCITMLSVVKYVYPKIPMHFVRARDVKLVTTNPKASKKDMVEWATYNYPSHLWAVKNNRYLLKNEHQADALAAIVVGLRGSHV